VSVGGIQHLPKRGGALLVANARWLSMSTLYSAWALSAATGRPVRFAGRPDIAPIGPLMQRFGGLLRKPEEIRSALRDGELVVVSTSSTRSPRHAGTVDPALIGTAVLTRTPVFPVATMSSIVGRAARVEVGAQVRPTSKRRGPLAELELAEVTQRHVQRLLDALGGLHTGVAPVDWLAEG
jgi:1-acyl-sn-glycerol-3-phosphate acyltransferase